MLDHKRKGPMEFISCNLHFKRNIDDLEYPYFDYTFTLFMHYEKHGILPYPGSHSEQPAKILEMFEIYKQLDSERQEKLRREQERANAKKGRK